jgi:hypothetical protein
VALLQEDISFMHIKNKFFFRFDKKKNIGEWTLDQFQPRQNTLPKLFLSHHQNKTKLKGCGELFW